MVDSFLVQQWEQPRDRSLPRDRPDEPGHFLIPDDDSHWDVFVPDDDEIDPLPEPGDFWIEPDE